MSEDKTRTYNWGMRIGLVSLHTSPLETPGQGDAGGMNVVVREAALALERLGHDVAVATRASLHTSAGVHELAPGSSTRVYAIEAGPLDLDKGALPGIVPAFGSALAQLEAFRAADVLHTHYWLSGAAALASRGSRNTPIFTTFHTVGAQKNAHLAPGDTPEPAIRIDTEQHLARSTHIIAGSQSERDAVRKAFGDPPLGSHVVHPGVDTVLFTPNDRTQADRAQAGGLSMLTLGRVQPLKGQDLALEAFAAFTEHFPDLARGSTLTIAGEASPAHAHFHAALVTRARDLNLPVTFLPAATRQTTATLLRGSDLVLVPSHSETFGLVALEAAASGTPVVAARTTGLIESVQDGHSGVLVSGRDPLAWATAIAQLVSNTDALTQMRHRAREFAVSQDWAAHARALEAIYR